MKLSLRKANTLQLLINEQINEPFIGSVTIGKFDDPDNLVGPAQNKLQEIIVKKFDLTDVYYTIRKKVAQKSTEVGIADLLTDLARNQKNAQAFKQLASTREFLPKPDVLQKALDEIRKEQPTNSYQRRDALIIGLFTKEVVETYAKTLKILQKEKQKISDKLLHLNVSSEIELDEKEVAVLNKYELL